MTPWPVDSGARSARLAPSAVLALTLAAGGPLFAQSIRTVAGGGTDDGRRATSAALYNPFGVAVDAAGNVLVSDFNHRRLRRVDARSGVITTVAGNGAASATGDGGPATRAGLASPVAAVADAAGNIYLSDQAASRVRRIDAASGVITTIAGTGVAGDSGDGGPATKAQLSQPTGLDLAGGSLLVADRRNHRVRRIDLATGVITTVAGTGTPGTAGDGGPATQAQLNVPNDVLVARDGSLLVADFANDCVRRVDASSGRIATVAGTCGTGGFAGDGGSAVAARLDGPYGLAADGAGTLYVGDFLNHRVRRVASGVITTVAGGASAGFAGDGGPATAALVSRPAGLAVSGAGLLVADSANHRVRRIDGGGVIRTVAGTGAAGYTGDGGTATAAGLQIPAGVALDRTGRLLVADTFANRVRRVERDGVITTIAGTGEAGFGGDGGPATAGTLSQPAGVAVARDGTVFVADRENNAVRKIDPAGVLTTVAGTGEAGFSGDGGPATAARLSTPWGVAVDPGGNLYVADGPNHCVRRVASATGIIDTVAGTPGIAGSTGDGGAATRARLNLPLGVAIDAAGNLLISDHANHRVRRVDLATGLIALVAGTGTEGFSGDGGPATAAALSWPVGVAASPSGDVLVADWSNRRVRRIAAGTGTISTVAGNGVPAYIGDDGPAAPTESIPGASLASPFGVAADGAGDVVVADGGANRIRVVTACLPLAAPSPTGPPDAAAGLTTPGLSWDAVARAFRYDVLLDTVDPPVRVAAADLAAFAFVPLNLPAGTRFYWRVVAKGDPYCTPRATSASAVRSFTTASGCQAPPAPALASPADGAAGVAAATSLSWEPSAGAASYDVAFGATDPPPPFASGLTSTTVPLTGLVPASTYTWAVTARAACDPTKTATSPARRFAVAGATCRPPEGVSLSSPADGATGVATDVTFAWSASAGASSYEFYLGRGSAPPLYLAGIRGTSFTVAGLVPGSTLWWKVVARTSCDPSAAGSSPVWTFTVSGACDVPAAPTVTFAPGGTVGAGQTYAVSWRGASDARGGSVVQRSLAADFSSLLDTQRTGASFAAFVAPGAATVYHRVRLVPACDPSKAGPFSVPFAVEVVAARPNVVFTVQPPAVLATLGESLEDLSTSFSVENVSSEPLQVIVSRQELASVPFFQVVDPEGGDAAFVTLLPREPKRFELRFAGPRSDVAGSYQGLVVVSAAGPGLSSTPYAFVNLKVGGSAGAVPEVRVDGQRAEYVHFPGFAGDDTTRPPVTVDVYNPGPGPMELGAEIGPEVWLVPEPGWNAQPVPPQGSRSLRLSTRRSRAPNGSALPRYTYLTLRTRDSQTARLLVQDNGVASLASGRSGTLHPSRRSILVPSVVKATSRTGNTFVSRLRLSNSGTTPVQAELDFTPAGADGYDATLVKRAVVVVPPNDVVALTDPLVQLFGLSPPVSGSLEVRAPEEQMGFLNVTSSVDAPARAGGTFGFQMPVVVRGDGAVAGSPIAVSGITGTARLRTNLILAETTGLDAAKVRVTLWDRDGTLRGETTLDVPRYGQRQLNGVAAELGGGDDFSAGRLEVEVVDGGGAVAAVTTVIDNVNDDASAFVALPLAVTPAALASAFASGGPSREAPLATKASLLVPAIVNGFATFPGTEEPYTFRSLMGFSSGTLSPATFVLKYDDLVSGQRLERAVTVKPRGTVELQNVVEELFGLPPGTKSQGPVFVEADLNGSVYCKVYSDLGAGSLGDAFPVVPLASEALTGGASQKPLVLDGLEQSVDRSRGTRSNLILNEVLGKALTLRVQLFEAGNRSVPIASRDVPLAPYEKVQLSTVFSELGLDTTERRKDRTNVQAVLTPVSGEGLASAVVTTIDNKTGDTKNAPLSPSGGFPGNGPGVGR